MSTLRLRLREATREQHDALEASSPMQPLLGEAPTRVDYAAFLSRQLAIYRPLERVLSGLPPVPGRAAKTPRLEADLRALGEDPSSVVDVAGLESLAGASPAGAAAGIHYVLEGASLGNALMLKHLLPRLGEDLPVAFLSGRDPEAPLSTPTAAEGPPGAGEWRTFLDWLETVDPAEHPAAETAARATFEAFRAALR